MSALPPVTDTGRVSSWLSVNEYTPQRRPGLHLSSNFWPEITSTNAADDLHAGHARGRSRGWFGRNQFGNRETFFMTAWNRGALVRKTAPDAHQSLKVV